MPSVTVVTDSSSCISPQLAESEGIEVVPFEMVFEGRVYRDGVDDPGDFYRMLRQSRDLPTTAAPSPGLFLEAFKRAARQAPGILCLTLPANLSSLYNSARQAADLARAELPNVEIDVMETGTVAAAQGLIALEAARASAEGAGLQEAAVLAARLASEVHFFATLDTLEYLARGGHVPKVAAWLGNVVGLRPILTAPGGDVRRISQTISRRGAVQKMLGLMAEHNPDQRPVQAMIMHAGVEPEAVAFRSEIESRYQCAEMLITSFTPVMGAHSGPGVLGVAFRVL